MPLSGEDRALLKDIYNRLDENKALKPEDANYAELYQPVYSHPGCEDPVELMHQHISFSEVESIQLFSGFRGSGKSTELFRLKKRLEEEGYVVLYADSLDYVSQSDEIDIGSLLTVIAGALSDSLEEKFGVDSVHESFWRRFTHYLTTTTVEISQISVKAEAANPLPELLGELKGGIDVKANLKDNPSFRQKVNQVLLKRLGALKEEVDDFVSKSVAAIQGKRGKGTRVVFLFDSLEQVRGDAYTEEAVTRSFGAVFSKHYPKMLRLPYLHVVYTVPPWLQFSSPNTARTLMVPCVRQWNNDADRTVCDEGFAALHSLAARRFGKGGYARVFGASSDEPHPNARKIIAACGGHFKDLLYMFRQVLLRAKELPVSEDIVGAAISDMRGHLLPIAVEDAHWLKKIGDLRDVALPTAKPEDVQRLTRFLDNHFVLYLKNGSAWYDIHPLIREEVARIVAKNPPSGA